jgi:hypothetical protein
MTKLTRGLIKDIVRCYRPRGYRIIEKGRHERGKPRHVAGGECDFENKKITCPPLDNIWGLTVFLHECGHAHLRHGSVKERGRPGHVCEYEAEKYCMHILDAHGIHRPAWINEQAKKNVFEQIKSERKEGLKIERKIARWAGKPEEIWRHKAL